jgi:hypothetical protein
VAVSNAVTPAVLTSGNIMTPLTAHQILTWLLDVLAPHAPDIPQIPVYRVDYEELDDVCIDRVEVKIVDGVPRIVFG